MSVGRFSLALIGLFAGVSAAYAQTPNPDLVGPMIQRPDWVTRPDGDDLADAYPELGLLFELEGDTQIRCTVTVAGNLQDCVVVAERPTGFGFGDAALAVAPSFQMRPETVVDIPRESSVTIPIRWSLPDLGEKPALPEPRPDPQRLILARRLVEPLSNDLLSAPEPEDDVDLTQLDNPVEQTAAEMIRLMPVVMQERRAEFVGGLAAAYAATYTLEELQALVSFVETPVGQRFWKKTGALNAAVQEQSAAFQESVMAGVKARLCATRNSLAARASAAPQP